MTPEEGTYSIHVSLSLEILYVPEVSKIGRFHCSTTVYFEFFGLTFLVSGGHEEV